MEENIALQLPASIPGLHGEHQSFQIYGQRERESERKQHYVFLLNELLKGQSPNKQVTSHSQADVFKFWISRKQCANKADYIENLD